MPLSRTQPVLRLLLILTTLFVLMLQVFLLPILAQEIAAQAPHWSTYAGRSWL